MEGHDMLIVKRGRNASRKKGIEDWIKEKLRIEDIKVMQGREKKKAAKVIFRSEKEKRRVWERKEELKRKYEMYMDEWLTIEERKERFLLREKAFELEKECKKKAL